MYSCVLLMACRCKQSRARGGHSTIYIRHGIIQLSRCNDPMIVAASPELKATCRLHRRLAYLKDNNKQNRGAELKPREANSETKFQNATKTTISDQVIFAKQANWHTKFCAPMGDNTYTMVWQYKRITTIDCVH